MAAEQAPDVVIVGSGPAGVSAAWPLVETGVRVLLLDASGKEALPPAPRGSIGSFRRDPNRPLHQFGRGLEALMQHGDLSPKLKTPMAGRVLEGFASAFALQTEGFQAFGSLGRGGLSNIWGALAPVWTEDDFRGFPFGLDALLPSYAAVMARIGMAGPAGAGPLLAEGSPELTAPARACFERYQRKPGSRTIRIQRAPNAVATRSGEGRPPCASCGLCLWGCDRRSIYSSAFELPALGRFPNFSYRPGRFVKELRPALPGHELLVDGAAGPEVVRARRVVLAAGTIGTTALVLGRLGMWDHDVRLLSNPVAAAAFLVPELIGRDLPERSFALAQLQWEAGLEGGETATGALYGADTLPLTELASRIPLSRPVALRVARALAPALLLATIYLPGRFSRNALRIQRAGPRVKLQGEITDAARAGLREAHGKLARELRALRILPVPGSFTVSAPGADAHYAGTAPMGGTGPLACSAAGALAGVEGVYVADGAGLSNLPSKHCTLTVMANADRIAREIAGSLGSGPHLQQVPADGGGQRPAGGHCRGG